jgi:hypothetical protein
MSKEKEIIWNTYGSSPQFETILNDIDKEAYNYTIKMLLLLEQRTPHIIKHYHGLGNGCKNPQHHFSGSIKYDSIHNFILQDAATKLTKQMQLTKKHHALAEFEQDKNIILRYKQKMLQDIKDMLLSENIDQAEQQRQKIIETHSIQFPGIINGMTPPNIIMNKLLLQLAELKVGGNYNNQQNARVHIETPLGCIALSLNYSQKSAYEHYLSYNTINVPPIINDALKSIKEEINNCKSLWNSHMGTLSFYEFDKVPGYLYEGAYYVSCYHVGLLTDIESYENHIKNKALPIYFPETDSDCRYVNTPVTRQMETKRAVEIYHKAKFPELVTKMDNFFGSIHNYANKVGLWLPPIEMFQPKKMQELELNKLNAQLSSVAEHSLQDLEHKEISNNLKTPQSLEGLMAMVQRLTTALEEKDQAMGGREDLVHRQAAQLREQDNQIMGLTQDNTQLKVDNTQLKVDNTQLKVDKKTLEEKLEKSEKNNQELKQDKVALKEHISDLKEHLLDLKASNLEKAEKIKQNEAIIAQKQSQYDLFQGQFDNIMDLLSSQNPGNLAGQLSGENNELNISSFEMIQ